MAKVRSDSAPGIRRAESAEGCSLPSAFSSRRSSSRGSLFRRRKDGEENTTTSRSGMLAAAPFFRAASKMDDQERIAADLALLKQPGPTASKQNWAAFSSASASEAESELGRSARSEQSTRTGSVLAESRQPDNQNALHYEGWLLKRTSAKLAGRWQKRYFVLDGPALRYCHGPGSIARRSFDIRRAKGIRLAARQPRELELDFGFRVWRLRADTPEIARRWLILLESGQLVSGDVEAVDCDDDFSDDDSGSHVSSLDSGCSSPSSMCQPTGSRSFSGPALGQGSSRSLPAAAPAVLPLSSAPSVVDNLEVDSQELDRKFNEFFPGVAESGSCVEGRAIRKGLERAMADLWATLASCTSSNGRSAPTSEPSETGALKALRCSLKEQPRAVNNAIEGILGEYLVRQQLAITNWLADGEPKAEEVGCVADWFFRNARPALDKFAVGVAASSGEQLVHWKATADCIESALLREWESRSCHETTKQVEAVYGTAQSTSAEFNDARTNLALGVLRNALRQWASWQIFDAASERATSVLIAAMNAVLRAFRAAVRAWFPTDASEFKAASKGMFNQARRELRGIARVVGKKDGQDKTQVPPLATLISAAVESAHFAEFCKEALEKTKGHSTSALCTSIFTAFFAAFERHVSVLCGVAVDRYFTSTHHDELKSIKFGKDEAGALAAATASAAMFVEKYFSGKPRLCTASAGDAVIQLLVQKWLKVFRRSPPKLSSNPRLPEAVEADVRALNNLAQKCGSDVMWARSSASNPNPVQPLSEVRTLLTYSPQDLKHAAEPMLVPVLGEEHGRALAKAVQLAALNGRPVQRSSVSVDTE